MSAAAIRHTCRGTGVLPAALKARNRRLADVDPLGKLPLRQALIHPVPDELPSELLRLLPTFTLGAINGAASSTPRGGFLCGAPMGLITGAIGERRPADSGRN